MNKKHTMHSTFVCFEPNAARYQLGMNIPTLKPVKKKTFRMRMSLYQNH